jgi:hypothetical protein
LVIFQSSDNVEAALFDFNNFINAEVFWRKRENLIQKLTARLFGEILFIKEKKIFVC